MQTITQLHEQGYQSSQIARRLGNVWRNQLLEDKAAQPEDFVLLQKLLDVPAAHNPERYLEIILLEFALQGATTQALPHVSQTKKHETLDVEPPKAPEPPKKAPTKPVVQEVVPEKQEEPKKEIATPTPKPVAIETPSHANAVLDAAIWPQILTELKKKYNTLYGVVRMAQPTFDGDTLLLGFSFAFHRKRLSEAKNQQIIADIVKQLTGQAIAIKCTDLKEEPQALPAAVEVVEAAATVFPTESPQEPAVKPDIAAISNIFGGGELLES
jgi:outer membrane biosynthesis protein TonB